jgi:hypothetical protein
MRRPYRDVRRFYQHLRTTATLVYTLPHGPDIPETPARDKR